MTYRDKFLFSMQVNIFSTFPEMISGFLEFGLLSKAVENKILNVEVLDIRAGADDRWSVDDSPFGGGPGMVLCSEPIFNIVEKTNPPRPLYLLSPSGRKIDQALFSELAMLSGFSLLCGRYEGVDARVSEELVDGELSLGDFVLQGGEVVAMAILEGVGRLLAGGIGNEDSIKDESFSNGILEYPQYTRPENFRGMGVPPVLLSGNHARIEKWRKAQALLKTLNSRPDLIKAKGGLSKEEERLLEELEAGSLDI